MLSTGKFVVILTAGIDLSVGSVLALGMMTLAEANQRNALADEMSAMIAQIPYNMGALGAKVCGP
jgi:ribose/xylose/arabinose/galactoside ABC-type transport system permease subunit